MSRESNDRYDSEGRLIAGYDYINQAWVQNGVYADCGHPAYGEYMPTQDRVFNGCSCYGRTHAGLQAQIYRTATGSQEERALHAV